MFKIGELVFLENGVRARIEGQVGPRRLRVMRLDGVREEHAAGDIAKRGEDADILQREISRDSWRYVEGGISNGRGGFAVRPAPNPDYVGTGSKERD